MLNEKYMISIAKKECIDMLGLDLIEIHEATTSHSMWYEDDGRFAYAIEIKSKPIEHNLTLMNGEKSYEFKAVVRVNPKSKKVFRDTKESRLPPYQNAIDLEIRLFRGERVTCPKCGKGIILQANPNVEPSKCHGFYCPKCHFMFNWDPIVIIE